jgi:transglutaminase-like putative cysteine protease
VAAVLVFLLVHRSWRLEASAPWMRGDAARGGRALVRAGVGLTATAVVLGAATGPLLPGAGSAALVDWKDLGGNNGTRVTLSPLVDIQARLVQQSDTEVFTVQSDVPANWRLTALDAFDGRVWKSSRRFAKVHGQLPADTATGAQTALVQQAYVIEGLSQIWLPAAFEPREIDASPRLVTRWEPTTSTLIVDEQTSDGLTYKVTSAYPTFRAEQLRLATQAPPDDIARQFLELPADFSPRVEALATRLTAGASTPYARALALQQFFRSDEFTYSTDVQSGHGDNRLEAFLFDQKTGYCEQFAGAYAAMARSIGLPARVAVGFTTGDRDPKDPTLYQVKGKHAHAWPEVYLSGYGWVPFEPTPGRGAPNAAYTGVPEMQDSDSPLGAVPDSSTTTAPPLSSAPGVAEPGVSPPQVGEPLDPGSGSPVGTGSRSRGWAGWLLFVLLGAATLYVALVGGGRWVRRAARRRRARSAAAHIDVAWREAVESLGVLGLSAAPAETPLEFAARAARQARLSGPHMTALASLATEARYAADGGQATGAPSGPGPLEVGAERALRHAASVKAEVKASTSVRQRVGYGLSPRALLGRRRPSRARRPGRAGRARRRDDGRTEPARSRVSGTARRAG